MQSFDYYTIRHTDGIEFDNEVYLHHAAFVVSVLSSEPEKCSIYHTERFFTDAGEYMHSVSRKVVQMAVIN